MAYRSSKSTNNAYRQHQQKLADNSSADPELQLAWFKSMKMAFGEMDEVFKLTCSPGGFDFLDVGCCPGGFSSYILEANAGARGTGMSLDVSQGGHEFLLEGHLRSRFRLIWSDVTKYQLGTYQLDPRCYRDLPFSPHSHPDGFSLVLLDGHALRTSTPKNTPTHALANRLLVSQLIVGLTVVSRGGTIVMKVSDVRNPTTKRLLWMFDALAADVRTWKPVCIHATRSTFYVIARGMGYGAGAGLHAGVLDGLRALWVGLTEGVTMNGTSLDFIVTTDALDGAYKPRLADLTKHIEAVHAQSLYGWREQVAGGF